MNPPLIAILTDFGLDDPYVGIMKGIIAEIIPGSTCIDITQQIPPGDIQRGAYVLWQAARDFPDGTVFLAVIDPGVGTSRKPIYLQAGNHIFIGPDNGLFSYLLYNNPFSIWELSNPDFHRQSPSQTFHGRDIFAPAAAYAAKGIPGDQFGSSIPDIIHLPTPLTKLEGNSLTGEVISSDRFGNLITSLGYFRFQEKTLVYHSWITPETLVINDPSSIVIQVNGYNLQLDKTFGMIAKGKCSGLIGSTGLLEIVTNQNSAARLLGLERGDKIKFSWD